MTFLGTVSVTTELVEMITNKNIRTILKNIRCIPLRISIPTELAILIWDHQLLPSEISWLGLSYTVSAATTYEKL